MKKGLILGAAALAAMMAIPTASDAAEVKFGGYYRVQGFSSDTDPTDESKVQATGQYGTDDDVRYRHRLHLAMDIIASEKTHAHLMVRPVEDTTITGVGTEDAGSSANTWDVKSMWLETEAGGIGIKAGKMNLTMNDRMLFGYTGGSTGAVILSKTFGGVTVTAGDIIISEGTTTANDDDNAYLLGVAGKAGSVSYDVNLLYRNIQAGSANGPTLTSTQTGEAAGVLTESDNLYLGATIGAKLGGIDLTVNGVYEGGFDNFDQSATKTDATERAEGSGFLLSARLKGSTGFGGWNAYGVYSSEDFDTIQVDPNWSYMYAGKTGDLGNALMLFADDTGAAAGANESTTGVYASALENITAVGAGLSIKAGNFTVTPQVDYMAVTEKERTVNGTKYISNIDDAWGGSLGISTSIDAGTTLSLTGAYLDADANKIDANLPDGVGLDTMHSVTAEIIINF